MTNNSVASTEKTNLVESQWEERDHASSPDSLSDQTATTTGPQIREISLTKEPKIWAVAGGKGGVGKSLICANIAIMLARMGKRVLAIDLDLGGSNLHTCLGVEAGKLSIGDWLNGRARELSELLMHTREPNLKIITGSADPLNVLKKMDRREHVLLQELKKLPFDDIVIDLGAGTQDSTIEFFLGADEGILSILPEPTSVENAYRFIRTIFLCRLRRADVPDGVKEIIDTAFDQKNFLGIRTPADLMAVVERLDPVALQVLQDSVAKYHPNIIVNQVRSQIDIDIGKSICSVCRRYFGLTVNYVGYLEYDNSVWKAVRSKNSVIHEYPTSILTSRFERITRTLLGEVKGLFP
ncbi:MAG: AAA family ATPase [Bdellovibrionota bacterium]